MAEEKKTGFFSKVKQKFNTMTLESSIENSYNKANKLFYLYSGTGLFDGSQLFGSLDEENNTFTTIGTVDAPYSSILADEEYKNFYYVTKVEHTPDVQVSIKLVEDGKENIYTRQATRFTLDKNVTKVDVIKVKDNYFLKLKEPEAK